MEDLRIARYDVIDSTNLQARRIAHSENKQHTLIIASQQTAGRGRMDRAFYSPARTGLYATLLYYPDRPIAQLSGLTCAAAWASACAIKQLCGLSPQIKWVNDLYLGGKKVCGILCESFGTPHGTAVAIGIGINLTTSEFPDALDSIAGSLHTAVDPEQLALCICDYLIPYLQSGDNALWLQDYRARFMLRDLPVICITGNDSYPATARDVTDEGALIVTKNDGSTHILYAGEVSISATDPSSPFYKL